MSDNFEDIIDDNVNNFYVIKKRLSDIKINKHGYFEYFVGNHYIVKIYPLEKFPTPASSITHHKKINVYLYELERDKIDNSRWNENYINIQQDPKFKNYTPIQYAESPWDNDGTEMPILTLCELVKYLHRLVNLNVFT